MDEPDVAASLREVAQGLFGPGVDHLREQTDVVGVREQLFEALLGLLHTPSGDQIADVPEAQDP